VHCLPTSIHLTVANVTGKVNTNFWARFKLLPTHPVIHSLVISTHPSFPQYLSAESRLRALVYPKHHLFDLAQRSSDTWIPGINQHSA
jgi:hypothetical protein